MDSELSKVEGKTSDEIERKQLVRLDALLGVKQASKRFRDPAEMFGF